MPVNHSLSLAQKRTLRVRSRLHGTAERPRLTIYRSNKHTSLQVINDDAGVTLASAQDTVAKTGTKTEKAQKAAEKISTQLQKLGVTKLVLDRGPYKYHGRIKAVAEVMRAAGVEV